MGSLKDYIIALLLIGLTIGVFFSVVIFSRERGNRLANRLLCFLTLCISFLLLESVIVLTGYYIYLPHLVSASFPFKFILGPLVYLYVQVKLGNRKKLKPIQYLHFTPFLIGVIDRIGFYILPGEQKIAYLENVFALDYMLFSPRIAVVMTLLLGINGGYLYMAWNSARKEEENAMKYTSNTEILNIEWIKKLTGVFAGYMVLYLVVFLSLYITGSYSVLIDSFLFLGLSVVVLFIAFYAFKKPEVYANLVLRSTNSEKYERSPLTEEESKEYARKLLNLMEEDKPYLKSDLRLPELADELSISTNYLSQVINQEFGVNFFHFVNEYRVEEAKKKLIHPDFSHYSFLAIAYEVGFSSKSSFNRVFKKHCGTTPSAYVQERKAISG